MVCIEAASRLYDGNGCAFNFQKVGGGRYTGQNLAVLPSLTNFWLELTMVIFLWFSAKQVRCSSK